MNDCPLTSVCVIDPPLPATGATPGQFIALAVALLLVGMLAVRCGR